MKSKKNQKVQSETHLQGSGIGYFVRKRFFVLSVYLNCFPHSVVDRPTAAYVFRTESITTGFKYPADRRDTGHQEDLQMSPRIWLSFGSVCLSL